MAVFLHERMRLARFRLIHQNYIGFTHQPFLSEQKETPANTGENANIDGTIRELQARLEAAHERLSDKEAVIADLREDRDRWRQQASALLSDQRPKGFWGKLFG